jgi:hypothetical protein
MTGPVGDRAVGRNVNVTWKDGAQSETTVAVDPTDPSHLLAASNDHADTTTVYESLDGGRSWANAGLRLSRFCKDPWLDFNAAGDAFFAYQCTDQRLAARRAGDATWTKTKFEDVGLRPDRDMVVVDTTPTSPFVGSVYIGYSDAFSNGAAYVLYSRDGFDGWTRSPQINLLISPIGVNVAVAPDGTIFATWENWQDGRIWSDRSIDGGATWGEDRIVHDLRIDTEGFFIPIPPQPDRGILPMPMTDVAPAGTPFAGRLYVAYPDLASEGGPATAIFVRHSDDGGLSWSPESRVNDDSSNVYHFHPAITVAPDGTVGVSFYDTRNDPTGRKADQYVAFSMDGGVTWSHNQRVSSASSDESGAGDPNDYGEYQGLDASSSGVFHQVWTDSRPGTREEDMVAARVRP